MNSFTKNDPMISILTVLFIIVVIFCIIYALCSNVFNHPEPISYETYIVEPYDTLWDIARYSDGWNIYKTRRIIDDIQKKSNVGDIIYPGQLLYIPMYTTR